jgi:hypothetical protein
LNEVVVDEQHSVLSESNDERCMVVVKVGDLLRALKSRNWFCSGRCTSRVTP